MRPVEKLQPGSTCVLEDGTIVTVKDTYKPHTDARNVLLANIGHYCSYCETIVSVGSNIQVEHVQPRGYIQNGVAVYKPLEYKWSNFLLSCATCNGRSNKACKDVVLGQVHLPHLNNTFKSLVYKEAGVVQVNPNLNDASKAQAEELRKLVGFDKQTGDDRIEVRRNMWEKAQNALQEYENGNRHLEQLLELIESTGFWSIWFTVFKNHDEVRKAMIDNFPGTAKNCFDPNNHYEPIDRNPNDPNDPV